MLEAADSKSIEVFTLQININKLLLYNKHYMELQSVNIDDNNLLLK